MSQANNGEEAEKPLQWWQLSLLGVACTIGTGYFLGSSIGITMGGPAILVCFLLAAFGTYMVFDVLAKMTADNPVKGSFRSYAKQAYGRWAGFSSGWVYWSSELLIMGSQLTALSLFTRYWFSTVPMWVFATGYGILGLVIVLAGTKSFDRVENLFAVAKIAAIVMFLIIALLALTGVISGKGNQPSFPLTTFFVAGITGIWASFIYAFYAYGGIEIMGLMAIRLHKPEEASKSGKIMIVTLASVYVLSIGLALTLLPWNAFQSGKSPFISALRDYNLPFVPHIFNGVFIIAGFSTMVASLFAITTMIVTLAEDRDAPSLFAKKWREKWPIPALGLTAVGLAVSIILALLMPGRIYEYFTTAAGLMLLYNWLFILLSSGRILMLTGWGQIKRYTGMALILLAISGTLTHQMSRPGFLVSLLFMAVIAIVTLVMRAVWKKQGGNATEIKSKPHLVQKERVKRLKTKVKAKPD